MTAPGYLLVAYALITTPLAVSAGGWIAVGGHLLATAVLLAARGRWSAILVPAAIGPLLYFTLPDLMSGWAGGEVAYRDPTVVEWETTLFGDPARRLASAIPSCAVSELLHAGYLSYYAIIFLPAALFWYRRDRSGASMAAMAAATAFVACYILFIAFPVEGPRYAAEPEGICGGPLRRLTLAILSEGSSRGAAFPSSHVAVAVALSTVAIHCRARWAPTLCVATLLLATGAVYGGFHYAVDIMAGAAVGVLAGWVARRAGWRHESPHSSHSFSMHSSPSSGDD